jgi:3-phenylpropionate/trans-cinnamate dioxygenase ferredoxin component
MPSSTVMNRPVDDRCPHESASLSAWEVEGCEIECPAHYARFDLGDVLSLPASEPATTYPVDVEDGAVYGRVET